MGPLQPARTAKDAADAAPIKKRLAVVKPTTDFNIGTPEPMPIQAEKPARQTRKRNKSRNRDEIKTVNVYGDNQFTLRASRASSLCWI